MNSSNSNSDPSQIKIKSEPGVNLPVRLSSFKPPRDLMLNNVISNKQAPKKVFTPNLNVTRNKIKGPLLNDNKDRRKHDKQNGRDRNKFNHSKTSNIVKTGGVFSEGMAPVANKRYNTRESSRDSSTTITKPVYKSNTAKKIDKEFEDLKIKEYNSDDDEYSDVPVNDNFLPIKLPMNIEGGYLFKDEDNVVKFKTPIIKKEEPILKSEVEDFTLTEGESHNDVKYSINKSEFNAAQYLLDPKSSLLMLQFPDSLPGRGPDTSKDLIKDKDKTDDLNSESHMENVCKFSHLEDGQIGKIFFHQSGKIKMKIGETFYDLALGSQTCFKQDVVSIYSNSEERTGRMINLGSVQTKLMAIPDWEQMLKGFEGS